VITAAPLSLEHWAPPLFVVSEKERESRRSALGEDDPLSFEERGVERPLAHCRKVEGSRRRSCTIQRTVRGRRIVDRLVGVLLTLALPRGPCSRQRLRASTRAGERRTARFPKFILVASRRGASFGDNGWTDIACRKIGVTSAWWSGQLVA